MKDPARFALAIAAVLAATALDAHQSRSSQASHRADSGTFTVSSSQPDEPSPATPAEVVVVEVDAGGEGYLIDSRARANIAGVDESDPATRR